MAFCSACGSNLATGAMKCPACGLAVTAVAMPKRKRHLGLGIALVVFIFVMLAVFASFGVFDNSSSPTTAAAQKPDSCSTNSFAYLLALKEGKSIASAYWKPGVEPKTLFDVRDFNEIKHGPMLMRTGQPYKVPRAYYQYEVESSTRGGIPIRKRWDVVMEPTEKSGGNDCAIVDLQEAQ